MTLQEGWFKRQAQKATEETQNWSATKQKVILREPETDRKDRKEDVSGWKCD
jgi:hypothetical protein